MKYAKYNMWLYDGVSPRLIDISELTPEDISIDHIAYALSNLNRYVGNAPFPYSVAYHSLKVSKLCKKYPLEGLLHDAAEAFIGDVPRYIKGDCPVFVRSEFFLLRTIFSTFNLQWPLPKEVKKADDEVLRQELEEFFESPPMFPEYSFSPPDPQKVRDAFKTRFHELTHRRKAV